MRQRSFGVVFGVFLSLFVSVFIAGCGGGSGGGNNPPATLKITTSATLTAGTVGTAYSQTLAATGGTAPYTWSVTTGTLPAGISLSGAGVLSGTPTAAGTSNFTIQAKDSASSAQTATLAATLVINAAPPPALAITTTSPLTPGTVGVAYSETLAATGGTTPYNWSVSAGTLPVGLTLSAAGVLAGTPTAAGTATFTITATDSSSPAQTATLPATLVINAPPPPALAITTTSPLPSGSIGAAYTDTLAATGGTPPYTWTVASGSTLPAGLSLSSAGVLSGTPTTAGTSTFTIAVADSGSPAQTATLAATLVIAPISVATTSLPAGNVGSTYADQLAATGGTAPYTWTLASGTLPAGIVLSPSGVLSGTPGSVTSSDLTFTVTDSTKATATSMKLTLVVNAATGTVPDNYYTFVFAGTSPQGSAAANGVAMNGIIKIQSGAVVSGFYDQNTNIGSPVKEQALSGGTLVLGSNGLGQLVLTTTTNTMTFALASPASVSTGGKTPIRMIEYDDATGTGSRGSGVIDPAAAAPTTGGISGNFAFLISGTDPAQNQQALIGSFQTDGAGNITGGEADANQVLTVRESVHFTGITGTYAVDANGRGLFTLKLGGTTFTYSFYEISPTEWLVISLDPATTNSPLVSGFAYQQTAPTGGFTTASIPTTSVLEISGVSTAGASPVPDISLGLVASDGAGNLTFTYDEYNGTLTSGNSSKATYTVDATTGRATTGDATLPTLYVIDSTTAFYVEGVPTGTSVISSGQSGILEAQSAGPFTVASFSGDYLGGSLPLVLTSVLNESGLVTADGAGNVNFTTNRSSSAGLVYQNDLVAGTYTVDATGRGVITAPDGTTRIFYVVSPTKIAFLTSDTGGYLGSFQQ